MENHYQDIEEETTEQSVQVTSSALARQTEWCVCERERDGERTMKRRKERHHPNLECSSVLPLLYLLPLSHIPKSGIL